MAKSIVKLMAGVEEGQEDNLELQGEGEAKKLIESSL